MASASIRKRRRSALHLGRYGEILSVFIKYGFADIVSKVSTDTFLSRSLRLRRASGFIHKQLSRWERVRLAIEELGPTFIKFGQFLSNRPDLLPVALVTELEKLQDNLKPICFSEIKEIIESDFKKEIGDVFASISEQAFASASIAQVHRAVLKNGAEVAVKVQKPKISQRIKVDIDILYHATTLIEKQYEKARILHLQQLVEEFEKIIEKELDFTVEATHLERFRRTSKHEKYIYFPNLYREFSTKKVLITEFIDGIKISDIDEMHKAQIDTRVLARHGAEFILKQIFDHGFFHADPHPGNILVRRDGVLCFLDFGAVGIIPPTLRYNLSILLYGMVNRDSQRIVKTLSAMSNQPISDMHNLEYELSEFIEEFSLSQLRDINIGEVLQRFFSIIINHNLKIVPGFYVLLKTLISIEGVGYRLDPQFNITESIEPFVKKVIHIHPRLKHLPLDIYFSLLDFGLLVKELPFDAQEIIRLIKNGELRIIFHHRGLEPVVGQIDQMVNRIIFSLVLAALIIGSSVVIHSGIPPKIYDIPFIGIFGYILAGFIGFSLLFSMIRHKKM